MKGQISKSLEIRLKDFKEGPRLSSQLPNLFAPLNSRLNLAQSIRLLIPPFPFWLQ
jgi:hypothetical protein